MQKKFGNFAQLVTLRLRNSKLPQVSEASF
jgi:hypothetical protein